MGKVAIVGSNGYIAGFIYSRLRETHKEEDILRIDSDVQDSRYQLELTKPEAFDYNLLKDVEFVIFTAAVSGPDKCAEEYEKCWKINVDGTIYFINNAIEKGCRALFFSSDAVFGDIPGYIYNEESVTQAATPYGKMKKAVEDCFKDNPDFKAIRLSYVMSARDRFVSYCLNCMKNGETAEIFHPFYRNCISVSDVVQVVMWLKDNWNEFPHTFLNVAGQELVSRTRIADELNRLFDNRLKYTISYPGEDFYKNRPMITQMESLYLDRYSIIINYSFTEKIKLELEDYDL